MNYWLVNSFIEDLADFMWDNMGEEIYQSESDCNADLQNNLHDYFAMHPKKTINVSNNTILARAGLVTQGNFVKVEKILIEEKQYGSITERP